MSKQAPSAIEQLENFVRDSLKFVASTNNEAGRRGIDGHYSEVILTQIMAAVADLLASLQKPPKYDTAGYSRNGGRGPALHAYNDGIDEAWSRVTALITELRGQK